MDNPEERDEEDVAVLLVEAGPNSSDIVHTKIRRQQPKSRPEIKQERKPDNRIKLYSASGHEIDCSQTFLPPAGGPTVGPFTPYLTKATK